jgi:hypothetical protein
MKQRGFNLPSVIILVTLFVSVPVLYFTLVLKHPKTDNVRGVATEIASSEGGVIVKVSSKNGTWDMFEFLCKSESECIQSLKSGKQWGVVSGGSTDGHEVLVEKSPEWKDFKFVKVFVHSAWGSISREFSALPTSDSGLVKIVEISDSEGEHMVALIPISGEDTKVRLLVEFHD